MYAYYIMRLDFIFSYWILIWFIAYVVKFTTFSPKFAFIIGIIENIGVLMLLIYKNASVKSVLYFFMVVIITKLLPLYCMRNDTIKHEDVIFTLALFVLYNAWLFINNTNFININMKAVDSMARERHDMPMLKLFNYIETKIAQK